MVGDWGGAGEAGTRPKEMTATHWPAGQLVSSPETDKFLLAVTLLEKMAVFQLGDTPDKANLQDSAARLDNKDLRAWILAKLLK